MKAILCKIYKALACPFFVFSGIAFISAFSLAAALTAEVAFNLEPCILCIYQRIPFLIALALSVIGIVLLKTKKDESKNYAATIIGTSGLAFLINSAIAFYHTGVELKWWRSAVEGCVVPSFGNDEQSILENILSAPTAPCDEIPWADPILGLSMANYNVLLCLGMAVLCLISLLAMRQKTTCA